MCYNSKVLCICNMVLCNVMYVIWYSKQLCKISRAGIIISILQMKVGLRGAKNFTQS